MVWCLCMARAPELGLVSKMQQVGCRGDVHPSRRHTHTALVMQSGMLAAHMTSYVSMGLVGYGQGTCSPMDVMVLVLRKWMAAH